MTEVVISRVGLRGDGIADGPIYVPRTLPGEVVSGTLDGQTLTDPKIVTPSDQRVRPPCRHYSSCGGCQFQHASDDFVADWKVQAVQTALQAHGLETEFRSVRTSPPNSRRRAGFAARRTRKGAMAGFYGRASNVIVETLQCQLLLPEVLAGRGIAQDLAGIGASRKAALTVLVTASETGLDIAVHGGKPLDCELRRNLATLCETHALARLSWDDEVVAMRAPPVQRFGGVSVSPPPGAFLQATAAGEGSLTTAVTEIVSDAALVIDLFAGCGTFSLPLARGAEVHAVEGEAAMLAALDAGWRHANGLKRVTTEVRDLFRRPLMSDELSRAEAVVLDPPRAGAEAQVAELAGAQVARVAYVSCNPVTFARDAAVLVQAGYRIDWIEVTDQFRWSSHIELAASFSASQKR